MPIHLMGLTSDGGLPIFTRKHGDCETLPFSTVACLNGVYMFLKSKDVTIKKTWAENDWIFLWKDFDGILTFIVAAQGYSESCLENLLRLCYQAIVLIIGLDELKAQHLNGGSGRIKRETKQYLPVIDKLLECCESGLLTYSDCILAAENEALLARLNEFSLHVGSLFCCLMVQQKIAVATEGWWDLHVDDRKLLDCLLTTSANPIQRDLPIFLPQKSPNTAYRLVSIPLTGISTLSIICGSEPKYLEIDNFAQNCFKNDFEILLGVERCIPRNFPETIEVDSSILGILLINKTNKKYVVSKNLKQSASGKRTMSGSHRIEFLRTFLHMAVDVVENYVHGLTNPEEQKDSNFQVVENYWVSDYHKCHALISEDKSNLICVLYVASVPTATMRLITKETLVKILQEKTVCW